jgi:Ca2+-binding RTX toxin-like protein
LFKKKLTFGIGILVVLLSVAGAAVNSHHLAWGANITCAGALECNGTTTSDDNNDSVICGRQGNDNLDLRNTSNPQSLDNGVGAGGDDTINGGVGDDFIIGDNYAGFNCDFGNPGADRLIGGPGNDNIFHGNLPLPVDVNTAKLSDGHKDYVDCGPGDDQAVINTSVDGDTAINCETVITG